MTEIKNTYFKWMHDEKSKHTQYMSGEYLPDPDKGPYHFINCEIHPGLWECMQQMYNTSKYTNTYIGN